MKVDFVAFDGSVAVEPTRVFPVSHIVSETDILTDVVLCPPHHLAPVPCCAVTRTHIDQGFDTCTDEALQQHATLTTTLMKAGIRCHILTPSPDLPDMCFTRDIGVSTPWGMVALNPAMSHRRGEVSALIEACERWNMPVRRIAQGTLEGGDICIAREGLLIMGMSGERSSAAGVEEFAAPFRASGWDILICPFHADHLHLDTIFCMIDKDAAIACIDLIDPSFLQAVRDRGISVLPMPSAMAASIGCNILSLGNRHILISARERHLAETLTEAKYDVQQVDVSQFAACGGGIHCLTQPIRRIG